MAFIVYVKLVVDYQDFGDVIVGCCTDLFGKLRQSVVDQSWVLFTRLLRPLNMQLKAIQLDRYAWWHDLGPYLRLNFTIFYSNNSLIGMKPKSCLFSQIPIPGPLAQRFVPKPIWPHICTMYEMLWNCIVYQFSGSYWFTRGSNVNLSSSVSVAKGMSEVKSRQLYYCWENEPHRVASLGVSSRKRSERRSGRISVPSFWKWGLPNIDSIHWIW